MTTLRSGGATHVGRVRSNNQDSFVVLDDAALFGVADGMGGHNGGEVASAMAVALLEEHAGDPSLEALKEAARKGNRAIFEKAGVDPELHGMGTTLCALRVVPGPEGDEIAWINVGDSRVYLWRDESLIQLSRDHSLVEDLLRDGQLTADEAAVHPKRNIITRALGIDVDVDVDGSTVIPFDDDRFILCSDGLFGEVSDDQIGSVLRRLSDPTEAAEELVRVANDAGGRDNITVVIVEVVDDDGRALAAATALAAAQARRPDDGGDAGVAASDDQVTTVPVDDAAPGAPANGPPPAFAGRTSSLPEATDDYAAEGDDPYADIEQLGSRRFTWRVAVFALALVGVAAVVVMAVLWSARNTYYVGFEGDQVALFKGRPDGVLWIDPEFVRDVAITRDDLPQDLRAAIDDKKEFGSSRDAESFIVNLQAIVRDERADNATTTTTTTTTAPVTTTRPPTTTTAVP